MADFDAKLFLERTSEAPGIYQMFGPEEALLYVGKAKNLKKRLSSYFRSAGLSIKTQAMMAQVIEIKTIVTHTEDEALILESNLIKANKPKYNVLLRDSKSYPFIHIDTTHDFPRLSFYRGDRSQPGRYFGPYPGVTAIRETLSMLQKVLPVRQCDDVYYSHRSRPCLQHQIKRCSAPCVDLVSKEDYAKDIELAALFLEGKDQSLNKQLSDNMQQASKDLDFEAAAAWRDRIAALKRVQSHQTITSGHGDIDVLYVMQKNGVYCVEVTFVRGGRHSGSNGHFPKVSLEESEAEVLAAFILQYYHKRAAPAEIVLSHQIDNVEAIASHLAGNSGHKASMKTNVRGSRKDWLVLARENVSERIRDRLNQSQSVAERLSALVQALNLEDAPERIECFDISHSQGAQTVASCVVYNQDGISRRDYRRYNIKGITPGDDYAAMEQALTRRFKRAIQEDSVLPDVLLIDGGKGQVSSAAKVLQELQLDTRIIVGVAKGEGRRPGLETLIFADDRPSLNLSSDSPALHLIQQVRDEAHRFAIAGHRSRRGKAQTQSILQEIDGIGPKRRQALLTHFGGLQGLQSAAIRDIASVPGISHELAQSIFEYLKRG